MAQYQILGGPYLNETGTAQYQLPGGPYVNETAGTGPVTHATTGALTGDIGSVAGTAAHIAIHGTTGSLTGQLGSVAGTAARFRAFDASGALSGQLGDVAGVAARFRAFPTSGALTGQGSSVVGAADRSGSPASHDTAGALVGDPSALAGVAAHIAIHGASGTLAGQGSAIAGTAARAAITATVARPSSDTSNSGWVPSSGVDLYAMLDETVPDPLDYIQATSVGAVCKMGLSTTAYPGTANQAVKYRASSSTGNSVIIRLKDGATTIRSATQALTPVDTEYTITLTPGEIAAITSGTLSVELETA